MPPATGVGHSSLWLVIIALLVSSAPAVWADDELARSRARLDEVERSLEQLQDEVRGVAEEVSALDASLQRASAELAGLERDLERAQLDHRVAQEEIEEARAEVVDRDAVLERALTSWSDGRDRLAEQAVHAYKHGLGRGGDVLVRGVVGARDWHEVAVTLETVSRLAVTERVTIDAGARQARELAGLRAAADQARKRAIAAERTAATEAERVATLTEATAATVDRIGGARAQRSAALARLEQDVEAREVLVAELEATIARLELSAQRVFVPVQVDLDPYGPPPAWADGLPGQGPRWAAAIDATATRHGLDGRLFAALVWSESGFSPGVVSHAGALGLAQLMPGTARGLGVDPHDPLQNLEGGARYLRTQLDAFGRVDLALAAYNAGPGRVRSSGGIPNIVETQLYVTRVLERYERLGG